MAQEVREFLEDEHVAKYSPCCPLCGNSLVLSVDVMFCPTEKCDFLMHFKNEIWLDKVQTGGRIYVFNQ